MQSLVGGRIDKVYDCGKDRLVVRVNMPDGGKREVRALLGDWLYLSREHAADLGEPGSFAMLLRKHLANGYIAAVRQHAFDRIVVLEIERGGHFLLVIELFKRGNVVLVEDGRIVQPLRPQTWEARTVRKGHEYLFPPAGKDPAKATPDELAGLLRGSAKSVVQCLATEAGMGGGLAEEALARAGLDKRAASSSLNAEAAKAICNQLTKILHEASSEQKPTVYHADTGAADVSPIEMLKHAGLRAERFESFSKAVEAYISSTPAKEDDGSEAVAKERGRFERQLAQQEEAVQRLAREAVEHRELGDALYANYQLCEGALAAVNAGREKGGWKEGERMLASIADGARANPNEGWIELPLAVEGKTLTARL